MAKARTPKLWKPSGRSIEAVVKSLLGEVSRLEARFRQTEERHKSEIEAFRQANSTKKNGQTREEWLNSTVLDHLLANSEPEEFRYEYHELRRSVLEKKDAGLPVDTSEIFVRLLLCTGIRPIYQTILGAQQLLEMAYEPNLDPRAEPKFQIDILDWMEIDGEILRLFLSAEKFYGFDDFCALISGNGRFANPQP